MWIVAKHKPKEFEILKESFIKVLGEMPEFYSPKIKYTKYLKNKLKFYEKKILDDYIICKHDKFCDNALVNILKNSRGLIYFLQGNEFNQKELCKFIKFCKSHEDKNGFLTQDFFKTKTNKAIFVSGPFTHMIFNIIEEKKNKIKVLINNMDITISKSSSDLLYRYI